MDVVNEEEYLVIFKKIKVLEEIYDSVRDVASSLNRIFSFQLLILTGLNFYSMVTLTSIVIVEFSVSILMHYYY